MISEVFNMDCMEGMKQYPDKYFELAIVDPPYGIGEHGGKLRHGPQSKAKAFKVKCYAKKDWDNQPPSSEYFKELLRVSKNHILWGGNYFDIISFKTLKREQYKDFIKTNPKGWIIWDKKGTDKSDFSDCELASSNLDFPTSIFEYPWIGFGNLNLPEKRERFHPTQKPTALYKWLLKNYAKEGDKILDTHLGSGSSRIAAYDMGFDFVGYELDKDYFDASVKRFEQFKSQLKMFA